MFFAKAIGMFFGSLIFDPKLQFGKGYRLCKMGDFQNGLISRIFVFFFKRVFAQNNCKSLVE